MTAHKLTKAVSVTAAYFSIRRVGMAPVVQLIVSVLVRISQWVLFLQAIVQTVSSGVSDGHPVPHIQGD
jgi:hypothetical protein